MLAGGELRQVIGREVQGGYTKIPIGIFQEFTSNSRSNYDSTVSFRCDVSCFNSLSILCICGTAGSQARLSKKCQTGRGR